MGFQPRLGDIQRVLRHLISPYLHSGDHVIDATAGKGRDTLFLAQTVGETSRVYAFDLQTEALAESRELLEQHHISDRVELILADHARMADYIKEKVRLVIFNLGYLPGGDHQIVTRPESTLGALKAALDLLEQQGLLVLTVYRGHEGGKEEGEAVEHWLRELPRRDYSVLAGQYINQPETGPYWITVQKHRED